MVNNDGMQDDKNRVATWIEDGLRSLSVREVFHGALFLERDGALEVCAIGLALVGKFGDPAIAKEELREVVNKYPAVYFTHRFATMLGVPNITAERIVSWHAANDPNAPRTPASKIAEMLRAGEI